MQQVLKVSRVQMELLVQRDQQGFKATKVLQELLALQDPRAFRAAQGLLELLEAQDHKDLVPKDPKEVLELLAQQGLQVLKELPAQLESLELKESLVLPDQLVQRAFKALLDPLVPPAAEVDLLHSHSHSVG